MSEFSAVERRMWNAWNALPDDESRPVHAVAVQLGMAPADVAFVVYPAETFGPWQEEDEP